MKMTIAIAAIALAGITGTAAAGSKSTPLNITATVAATCDISTTPLAFGSYDPTAATATNGNGTVTLTCVKGSLPVVSIDLGANAVAAVRNMKGVGTDVLSYELYQPANNAVGTSCAGTENVVWGDGTNGSLFNATAATDTLARSYNICGRIASGQNVAADSYSDTVTAKVDF